MKRIVRYTKLHSPIVQGCYVYLFPLNHPNVTPGRLAMTSPVTVIHENGFETANTRYMPDNPIPERNDDLPEFHARCVC